MSSFSELQKVIAAFFSLNPEDISASTTARDVENWDSFSHMELITHIEDYFKVKIPFVEVMEFNCLGDIATYLDSVN